MQGLLLNRTCLALRYFHTSSSQCVGAVFRAKRNLAPNSNQFGPLTDLPDWSYKDENRPRVFTSNGQRRRARKNIEYAKQAIRYINEIKDTENIYKSFEEELTQQEKRILSMRLKPKGPFLKSK